jgi:formylglycine-generating enzyme required for sulfatase activity
MKKTKLTRTIFAILITLAVVSCENAFITNILPSREIKGADEVPETPAVPDVPVIPENPDILAIPVTITGLSVGNKLYDGTTAAVVTGAALLDGVNIGDDVTVIDGTAVFADKYVGNGKTVTFSGYSLGGTDADKYVLSAQPASVTANIEALVIGIETVWIPAGTFMMGSPETEEGRYEDEDPQHSVTLTSGFYMGKYEVTQEQYQAVMGSNPSGFKAAVAGESGTPGKLPVERVFWYDAIVFCNKLSMMEGLSPAYRISGSTDPAEWGAVPWYSSNAAWDAVEIVVGSNGYRLPTEAQWEYACRAGTTTAFNNGNDDYKNATAVGAVAWCTYNSSGRTHEVGLKQANAWGLYDMHGNVWEWCWDWIGPYPSLAPQTDPVRVHNPLFPLGRLLRGGGFKSDAELLRSAIITWIEVFFMDSEYGFRIIRP